MFCNSCGKEVAAAAEFCPNCGNNMKAAASAANPVVQPQYDQQTGAQTGTESRVSAKTKKVTFLLAFFLGAYGAHRFYVGKIKSAIAMLILTIIAVTVMITTEEGIIYIPIMIWWLIDWIMVLAGKFKDKNGLLVTN
jgi:TM2 domain-containing membrane protein YozV